MAAHYPKRPARSYAAAWDTIPECIWQHRFATYAETKTVITAWIHHYNETVRTRAWLSHADGVARASGTINCITCPESVGSTQSP